MLGLVTAAGEKISETSCGWRIAVFICCIGWPYDCSVFIRSDDRLDRLLVSVGVAAEGMNDAGGVQTGEAQT